MLNEFDLVANVAVKDYEAAKRFYGETLGLELVKRSDFGATYKSGSTKLFVYPTPMAGGNKATVANWEVKDIKATIEALKDKVNFEHYEYPGATYDGPIHIAGGMKAAWFKDPDGNILGIVEAT